MFSQTYPDFNLAVPLAVAIEERIYRSVLRFPVSFLPSKDIIFFFFFSVKGEGK